MPEWPGRGFGQGPLTARSLLTSIKELFCLENLSQALSPIADLALTLNYQRGVPSIYTAIGSYLLFVEEDLLQGRDYLRRALEKAEEVKDYFSMGNACYLMGPTLSWNCYFQRAREYFQKSLGLSKGANNLLGILGLGLPGGSVF